MTEQPERVVSLTARPWTSLEAWIKHLWSPRVKHPRLGPGGQCMAADATRQYWRHSVFRAAQSEVDRQFSSEPRRARRRIARARAKDALRERRD